MSDGWWWAELWASLVTLLSSWLSSTYQPVPELPTDFMNYQTVIAVEQLPVATPEPTQQVTAAQHTPPAAPVVGDWLELLSMYDWNVDEAYSVMMCESGGRADVVSSAGAVGLFQIHPYNEANFDPATNVAAAYRKWQDGYSRGNRWAHWNQWGGCGHFY